MLPRLPCSILALAALSSVSFARNCWENYFYCGKTLIDMGDYKETVTKAVVAAQMETYPDMLNESLFYCNGNDDLIWQQFCGKCENMGHRESDYCPLPNNLVNK